MVVGPREHSASLKRDDFDRDDFDLYSVFLLRLTDDRLLWGFAFINGTSWAGYKEDSTRSVIILR
jgi:hypothetical protein